ncbi:PHP domain-containing protein [Helicovermis profundi]|uniref:PHP domain-containing protein n=1 Tax=Helicovermis profundi TaxID=3065157 RepID=A0AAU9E5K9_9FIRM|nr:PHP domain-containing protein [Clostridia bacterium S502]
MFVFADYHTHTTYSHGKGSIEDNVKVAIEKGLREIAISDHGPGHMGFGIKRKKYKEMRNVIDQLNVKYNNINILLGLEANVLDIEGNIDIDEEMMEYNDILLVGYHFGSKPTKLYRDLLMHFHNYRSSKSDYSYKKVKEINTISLVNAINKYSIDLITHPGAKGPIDLFEVSTNAKNNNTALEINSSHGHLTVDEIKLSMNVKGLEYIISSDAHIPTDVGNFSKAIERAELSSLDISRIRNAE